MKKKKPELNGVCNIHESTLVAGEGVVESEGSPSSVDSKRQSAFGQSYDACVHPVELTFLLLSHGRARGNCDLPSLLVVTQY